MPKGVYPRTVEHSQRIREGTQNSAAWHAARKDPKVRAKQSLGKTRWWKAQKAELAKEEPGYISRPRTDSSTPR